ncbi:MAG: hypothetical protein Q4D63_07195 [Neisseria animaloris]|nr:hypothetical protein [Neisseria animaloris]
MKFRYLYTLAILLLAAFLAYTFATRTWLQTDLTALLPAEQTPDVLLETADKFIEKQLNGQVVLLAGSDDAEKAFQTASDIAEAWRKSGVFAEVDSSASPDLAQIRQDVRRLGLAVLPPEQRKLLADNPQQYFQARAEAAVNPFSTVSPLPLEQDWLGFGRFVMERAAPQSRLQWNADNGMLFSEENGKTRVWLRGRLPESNHIANGSAGLLPLLERSRKMAAQRGVETLSAGGAVFAAAAKAGAERESRLMAAAGLLLTFTLLLWVFRSARVFWLTLPLAAGLLTGLAAALLVFGEVHILTIVIGTSLVGMLADFPLHWLTPSVFAGRPSESGWRPVPAMRHVLPTFAVSLLITVLGYALLWFTPLPVLRQTAVFSGFALVGAFGATVLWLPVLFKHYRSKEVPFTAMMYGLDRTVGRLKNMVFKPLPLAVLLVLAAFGLWRSDWRDDIRQWTALSPEMLAEARRIGELSGTEFGGQYVLVEAGNQDALLQRNAEVHSRLQPLMVQRKLAGIQSLDQWMMPVSEQKSLQNRLRGLSERPETWAAMREIGVPDEAVRAALQEAAEMPAQTLSDGLQTQISEGWQPLYLGEVSLNRFASIVRLNGIRDAASVQAVLKNMEGVHWADKRAHLNELFLHTRNQAAWLKLVSYALAWFLLWRMFGTKRSIQILAVPLAAAGCTVAVLGWLGIPISLFAMFGLLLVSAIGVDYAVYAIAAKHSAPARLGGMMLAAMTTGISFALLGMSGTPAVAAFGISVAAGVVFNLIFAGWLLKEHKISKETAIKSLL